MNAAQTPTMLTVLRDFYHESFSGCARLKCGNDTLTLWFVRGALTHAKNEGGEVGWHALSSASKCRTEVVGKDASELPPERSVRLTPERLFAVLEDELGRNGKAQQFAPIPLHAHLEARFREMKKRINGLSSLHTRASQPSPQTESANTSHSGAAERERIVLEIGPRGATWTHIGDGQEILLEADTSLSTAELLRAGEELMMELGQLKRRAI
ncbi:MAG: hypothetical protein H6506_00115 [Calditrichaeota bacterium]|nr:hypothetical protein [Calditrichota bacterium]MCB9391043.1 hypothetical protein [Calditrichota bacterium]